MIHLVGTGGPQEIMLVTIKVNYDCKLSLVTAEGMPAPGSFNIIY